MDVSQATVAIVGVDALQTEKIAVMLRADANVPRQSVFVESDFETFYALLKHRVFDVVIFGNGPDLTTDLESIRRVSTAAVACAIFYLVDYEDEKLATAALAAGAQDIIVKRNISGLLMARTLVHGMERAKMRAERRVTNQRLVRLNEEMNRFLGMAAHDLRGPIGTIGGFADLVLADTRDRIGPDNVEALEAIKRSSKAMVRLIEELLDMSSIESGKHPLQLSRVDLKEFLTQCVRQNMQMAGQKDIVIDLQCCDGATIVLDADKMTQVMGNMISNAVKYSRPGSRVLVEGFSLREGIEVRVQDWGPGISKAEAEQLFTPFFRGAAKPTAGETSTGLGLPIVKGIVAEHHGQVGVVSDIGVGSTFWFKIPQRRAEPMAAPVLH